MEKEINTDINTMSSDELKDFINTENGTPINSTNETSSDTNTVVDETENVNENENDAVNLTPTPTPFPTYGTGIAGLDWASLAPQFGPQYPGHYSNQGIQPNFANWYDNLNKYYG